MGRFMRRSIQAESYSSRFEEGSSDFFEEFPFAIAGIIAQYFGWSKHTIKEILQQELGLRRFSRRCVPHLPLEVQKVDRRAMTNDLLSILHRQADYSFFGL
jgi:hypothetical protein